MKFDLISQNVAFIWFIFIIPSTEYVAGMNEDSMFIACGIASFGHIKPGRNIKIKDVATTNKMGISRSLKIGEIVCAKKPTE